MTAQPDRETRLQQRREHFESLPDDALESLWRQREALDLEPAEIELLRTTLRKRKGIHSVYSHRAQTCPRCGMVDDNCVCFKQCGD